MGYPFGLEFSDLVMNGGLLAYVLYFPRGDLFTAFLHQLVICVFALILERACDIGSHSRNTPGSLYGYCYVFSNPCYLASAIHINYWHDLGFLRFYEAWTPRFGMNISTWSSR